jgi:hypothetical protein
MKITSKPTAADLAQAQAIVAGWIMLDRDKLIIQIAQALAAARAAGFNLGRKREARRHRIHEATG